MCGVSAPCRVALLCPPGIMPLVTLFLTVPKINTYIWFHSLRTICIVLVSLCFIIFVYVNFVGMPTYFIFTRRGTLKSLKDLKHNLAMILFK